MFTPSRFFKVDSIDYEYWNETTPRGGYPWAHHRVRNLATGYVVDVDWHPDKALSDKDLMMFVKLGFPRNKENRHLTTKDLETMYEQLILKSIVS